jgi:FkbM family methyltransferase
MNTNPDTVIFDWLQDNLKDDCTIVDIGAKFAGWFQKIADQKPNYRRAYLFEPQPKLFANLQNRVFADENRVTVYANALSDTITTADFHIDVERKSWSGLQQQRQEATYETVAVDVTTLDSFNFDVDFIKIDVEGNELFTLRGAKDTIVRCQPIVYFEGADVHLGPYGYTSDDVLEFFDAVDYDVFDLDLQRVDVVLLQQHFACDSSYYHNFIAMPRKG